ncbi:MAG: hypothetical protein ABR514_05580 [Chthoniobacterales bacterium]
MWQLHSMSSTWGESNGFVQLIERISHLLAQEAEGGASRLPDIIGNYQHCRVCHILRTAEAAYAERLAAFVAGHIGRKIYERSQGVCLRHLARLLSIASHETHGVLLTTASHRFLEMRRDMQGYAKKREATRRDLINADESDASWRALVHFAGAEDYSNAWPDDCEI